MSLYMHLFMHVTVWLFSDLRCKAIQSSKRLPPFPVAVVLQNPFYIPSALYATQFHDCLGISYSNNVPSWAGNGGGILTNGIVNAISKFMLGGISCELVKEREDHNYLFSGLWLQQVIGALHGSQDTSE